MDSPHPVAVELDGIRLSDWIESAGLSRSTAYELIKLLAIEPEARRVPTSRKPVSHLNPEQLELLQPWAEELRRGTPLPQIRERLGRLQTVPDSGPGPSDTIPDDRPGQSQIVPVDPIAALAAALQPLAPPADPLRSARALAEAASLAVPLSSAELAAVLGLSVSTVSSWPDGHSPRPGFRLRRQKAGAAVWWMVERPGSSDTIPAIAPAPEVPRRAPGFVACIDAPVTVVSRLQLPSW